MRPALTFAELLAEAEALREWGALDDWQSRFVGALALSARRAAWVPSRRQLSALRRIVREHRAETLVDEGDPPAQAVFAF